MFDYQWPQAKKVSDYFSTTDWIACEDIYKDLEQQLSEIFGCIAVLLPSGRAALSSIFDFLGASRQHIIYAPKYSSHCIWDVVGQFSNPTIELDLEVDIAVAVHKWGYVSKSNLNSQIIMIDDSVDSIITNPKALFPSGGEFEIISLPKIVGSHSGAVVLSKNEKYVDWIKEIRLSDKQLIANQSFLKYVKCQSQFRSYTSPDCLESKNRGLDLYSLRNILDNLGSFHDNKKKIMERLEVLDGLLHVKNLEVDNFRLPCVYPLDTKFFKTKSDDFIMQRHFDFNQSFDNPSYSLSLLIPLHFGVDDLFFDKILKEIILL